MRKISKISKRKRSKSTRRKLSKISKRKLAKSTRRKLSKISKRKRSKSTRRKRKISKKINKKDGVNFKKILIGGLLSTVAYGNNISCDYNKLALDINNPCYDIRMYYDLISLKTFNIYDIPIDDYNKIHELANKKTFNLISTKGIDIDNYANIFLKIIEDNSLRYIEAENKEIFLNNLKNEVNKDKGLILKDKVITSLTGPISIHILKPTLEFHNNYNAPIFILFGDKHFSTENYCECKDEFCTEIFSNDFIKSLDEIALDYPINFNIEAGLKYYKLYTEPNEKLFEIYKELKESTSDAPPMIMLKEGLFCCYNRVFREKFTNEYLEICPTKNIKWHLVDPRDYDYKHKYNHSSIISLFVDIIIALTTDVNKIRLKELIEKYKTVINNEIVLNSMEHILDEDYYKYIDQDTSLTFKQIRKMPIENQKQWEIWIEEYYKYYYNEYIRKYNTKSLKTALRRFINRIKKFNETDNIKYITNYNVNIGQFEQFGICLLYINSIDLDTYFLARSFKIPKNSINPEISIGYFGAKHTKNINYFLTKIMGNYNNIYTKVNDDNDRCLLLDTQIDLEKLVVY